ncbi:MAG: fibronectin type III domain-containing protein [Leptospirales bacterium]|nr:fibronectin type III domain-containing protein [Leptospirales bacterium]
MNISLRRLLALAMVLCCSCQQPQTTPEWQFILAPWLIEGGGRPATPQHLSASYDPYAEAINLRWDLALDPAAGIPVYEYRIYLYLDGPPQDFYRAGDLLDRSAVNFYSVEASPFTGTLYFVVTAWNGGAESYPSNTVGLSLL